MEKNIDTQEIREFFYKNVNFEKKIPYAECYKSLPKEDIMFTKKYSKIASYSCNGNLLPNIFLKKKIFRVSKYDIPRKEFISMRQEYLIYDDLNDVAYKIKKDTFNYMKNYLVFIFYFTLLKILFPYLKDKYKKYVQRIDDKYWKKFFI